MKCSANIRAPTNEADDFAEPQAPTGTKKVIIFDTNAYRHLTCDFSLADSRSIALRLRQLEQKAGNFALASPIVIWELVGHLGDTNDPAYNYCLNALVVLAEHTWSPIDSQAGVCLFADAASTVCRELFRVVPPTAVQNIQNLSKLAAYVRHNAPNLTLPAALTNLKVFSMELARMETQWLTDMQNNLTDYDPKIAKAWVGGKNDKDVRRKLRSYFGSHSFMDAWATITVVRHAKMLGVKLTREELSEKTRIIRTVFPVPFHL